MNDLRNQKILIVDDMEANVDILVQALQKDYRVGMAMNGRGAIEYAKRSLPDLILLDIMMSGINGFEVCQNLKEDPLTRRIPIIFITALDASEHKTRGFEIGAVDYITRPFDITEVKARVRTHLALKTAREALKSQNRMLEEKVKERTALLEKANEELQQKITECEWAEQEKTQLIEDLQTLNEELNASKQRLEETTAQMIQSEKLSALGELTAGVSHELNQPLNGIKIVCQSLLRDIEKDRFDEEELADDLEDIVGQVNKMAEIIDHMRIYTRHTEGEIRETLDLKKVIEGPFKLLDQKLRNHNIAVIREFDSELPMIVGDPIRLEQVFLNLINNARNALDECGRDNKQIEIRTYKADDPLSDNGHSAVVAEVRDNGGGVPEDLKEKIFQPFFTTKESGKGTGLGLSVSHKIIEEHQGKIELESSEGEGTTFKVILPAGA